MSPETIPSLFKKQTIYSLAAGALMLAYSIYFTLTLKFINISDLLVFAAVFYIPGNVLLLFSIRKQIKTNGDVTALSVLFKIVAYISIGLVVAVGFYEITAAEESFFDLTLLALFSMLEVALLYLTVKFEQPEVKKDVAVIKIKYPIGVAVALALMFLYFGYIIITSYSTSETNPPALTEPSSLSYDMVARDQSDQYIGKTVQWQGTIATDLSQISGIKFYITGQNDTSNSKQWYWAIPQDEPSANEVNGKWVTFMLGKYGNIKPEDINPATDVYLVTGKLVESDCDIQPNICIPNIIISSIKKIGTN
ncbi:MAG: hypothetical protein WC526_02325 [Patescibacteria group bacterium]